MTNVPGALLIVGEGFERWQRRLMALRAEPDQAGEGSNLPGYDKRSSPSKLGELLLWQREKDSNCPGAVSGSISQCHQVPPSIANTSFFKINISLCAKGC